MTFYIVSATCAATLVGLLFVAVHIGPPLTTPGRTNPRHAIARSTFTVFAVVFMLSLLFAVPNITLRARAFAAIAAALGGCARAIRTWLPVWSDRFAGRIEFRLWQAVWLLVAPVLAYAFLASGAVRTLVSVDRRVFDLNVGYAFVALIVIGLRNSWNLLVEGSSEN
jgi:hypothetical protein